jgi:oxygen-independent coproporphyrinogen-3 oxidase
MQRDQPIRLIRAAAQGAPPQGAPGEAGRPVRLRMLPPLSLYVHLPWCIRKCPYCDFNSHAWRASAPLDGSETEARYVDALLADLQAALPQVWGRRVGSVFLGGGTPSLFSPRAIERLLEQLRALLPLEPDCEITLEANPGSFERGRFAAFRSAGVNRLSIGVQSFDDMKLQALGRVHSGDEARSAIEEAARCFERWNLDLMVALPGQTRADCAADVAQALAFAPPHLSLYQLTIEPNTLFAAQPPAGLPDDELAVQMQDDLEAAAAAAGLRQYEVSAFARAGFECRHNLNYWRFGDYLGIGAGAHGKLSFAERIVRQTRFRHPQTYVERALAGKAVETEREVPARELPFEFMLNALRLRDGVPLALFAERCGLPPETLQPALERAQARGLLRCDGLQLRASDIGFRFLNDLQQLFLPDD